MEVQIGLRQVAKDGFVVVHRPVQVGQPDIDATETLTRGQATAELLATGFFTAAEIEVMFEEASGEYVPPSPGR